MTPLGHLAVSYSLGKGAKVYRGAFGRAHHTLVSSSIVVGGLAPDLDFLLIGLPSFNALHRSLTHNLFFVLGVAALYVLLISKRDVKALSEAQLSRVFCGAVTGGLSHLFLDAILDSNTSNGVGVAALWPLSPQFFSPFNLAPQRCPGWEEPFAATLCNLPLVLWEVPCYILAALLWRRSRRAHANP